MKSRSNPTHSGVRLQKKGNKVFFTTYPNRAGTDAMLLISALQMGALYNIKHSLKGEFIHSQFDSNKRFEFSFTQTSSAHHEVNLHFKVI